MTEEERWWEIWARARTGQALGQGPDRRKQPPRPGPQGSLGLLLAF